MKKVEEVIKQEVYLGHIEPQSHLLTKPDSEQLLYKVMSLNNLICSITKGYLNFNRVDRYRDFHGADTNDGLQLPLDRPFNESSKFYYSPSFSIANMYDLSRERTYACCFSLTNSNYIWENYALGDINDKVCVVFKYEKLREYLNKTIQIGNSDLEYNGKKCKQIFSINYGKVNYVDWESDQVNNAYLSNPIIYTFMKCKKKFSLENEFRISLSALGVGKFVFKKSELIFPDRLEFGFNFHEAIVNGVIQEILCAPDSDTRYISAELSKLRIDTTE